MLSQVEVRADNQSHRAFQQYDAGQCPDRPRAQEPGHHQQPGAVPEAGRHRDAVLDRAGRRRGRPRGLERHAGGAGAGPARGTDAGRFGQLNQALTRHSSCESQELILKELHRADTVTYFRTEVNNLLARFDVSRVSTTLISYKPRYIERYVFIVIVATNILTTSDARLENLQWP